MVVDDAYSTIYMYIYGIYHLVYYVREYRNSDRSIPYFIPVSEKRQYTGIPQCNVDVGCLLPDACYRMLVIFIFSGYGKVGQLL